jgi:hypothetical protein
MGIKDSWEDCSADAQAHIIGYNQVREKEELDELKATVGAKF